MTDPAGRRVRAPFWNETGAIVRWEPLGSGMTDTLVRLEDGREVWFAMSSLRPTDGLGSLPDHATARAVADAETLRSLNVIRAQHIADWRRPWLGCEHGKALLGQALDGAIAEVRERVRRRR